MSEEEKEIDLEYLMSDEGQKEIKDSLDAWFEENRKEMEEAEKSVLAIKLDPPEFQCTNPNGWTKALELNNDGYGRAALLYAHDFAKALEAKILQTNSYEGFACLTDDMIKECERIADERPGGITGFMYGAAIATLKSVWRYGNELAKWHNKQWGVEDSDGVVNPAVVSIG